MRMTRQDRPLTYYAPTWAPNAEGILVSTLGTGTAFTGDLQPLARTASRKAEYGLDSTEAKGKALYYDSSVVLLEGYVVDDAGDKFMVSGPPSLWPSHSEAVLVKWNG